jgi:hypothetical protein
VLIKREIGDIDLDKAAKDKSFWRGKAETIELLKIRIKALETELAGEGDKSSNNLSKINSAGYSEYKKEKEQFKVEMDKLKDDNTKLSTELSRNKTRKDLLEKEIKQQKDDLTCKIKILLEKNDNDEKLILALTKELDKKGSSIATNINRENIFNLQQEIIKLRTLMKEKEEYIKDIQGNIITDPNGKFNAQSLSLMMTKMKELEKENKKLKNESDEGRISESIAKENVKLRLRIKELEDRLYQ